MGIELLALWKGDDRCSCCGTLREGAHSVSGRSTGLQYDPAEELSPGERCRSLPLPFGLVILGTASEARGPCPSLRRVLSAISTTLGLAFGGVTPGSARASIAAALETNLAVGGASVLEAPGVAKASALALGSRGCCVPLDS